MAAKFDIESAHRLIYQEIQQTMNREVVFNNVCRKLGHVNLNYKEFTNPFSVKYDINTYLFFHNIELRIEDLYWNERFNFIGKLYSCGYDRESILKELDVKDEILASWYSLSY